MPLDGATVTLLAQREPIYYTVAAYSIIYTLAFISNHQSNIFDNLHTFFYKNMKFSNFANLDIAGFVIFLITDLL